MDTHKQDQQQHHETNAGSTNTSAIGIKRHRHPDDVVVAQHQLASRCQTCNLKLMSVFVTHNNILRRNDPILIHDSSRHHEEPTAYRNQSPNNGQAPSENTSTIADLLSTSSTASLTTSRLALQVEQVSLSLVECIKQLQEVSAKAIRIEGLLTQREALGNGASMTSASAASSPALRPVQGRIRAGSTNSNSSGARISATAGTREQPVLMKMNVPCDRVGSRVDAREGVSERQQLRNGTSREQMVSSPKSELEGSLSCDGVYAVNEELKQARQESELEHVSSGVNTQVYEGKGGTVSQNNDSLWHGVNDEGQDSERVLLEGQQLHADTNVEQVMSANNELEGSQLRGVVEDEDSVGVLEGDQQFHEDDNTTV